jgi:hypothetical protein
MFLYLEDFPVNDEKYYPESEVRPGNRENKNHDLVSKQPDDKDEEDDCGERHEEIHLVTR